MKLSCRRLAFLSAALIALPAGAVELQESVSVPATAAAAWSALGDFCGIGKWHPAIAHCQLSEKNGATFRTLTLKGGGTIVEKLLHWDDLRHSYSYAIVSGPLPVAHYRSTIAVSAVGKGAKIVWSGHFKAKGASDEDAKAAIGGVYKGGLDSLSQELSR